MQTDKKTGWMEVQILTLKKFVYVCPECIYLVAKHRRTDVGKRKFR